MIAVAGKTSSMAAMNIVVARWTDPTTHDWTTRGGHGTTAPPHCRRRRTRRSSVIPRDIGSIRWTTPHCSPATFANVAEVVDAASAIH